MRSTSKEVPHVYDMIGEKYRRHFWYRIARAAPTSSIRRAALSRVTFVDLANTAYVGPTVTLTPLGGETPRENLLIIGDRATVSPNVSFLCSMHPEGAKVPGEYGNRESITVENDVWIGADATILGGVTLGARSIVGAGAVVTTDVPPETVVGGVPASVIRDHNDQDN